MRGVESRKISSISASQAQGVIEMTIGKRVDKLALWLKNNILSTIWLLMGVQALWLANMIFFRYMDYTQATFTLFKMLVRHFVNQSQSIT